MATLRGLTTALSTLSISPSCIRNIAPRISQFSTTSVVLGGPITRVRRERTHAKLKRAKARAEELRLQREARADPIVGHSTEFTKSLLRPREILAQPGIASHTRAGEENWPILTNFGIGSDDALTLAVGAKAAAERRLKSGNVVMDSGEQILYHDVNEIIASKKAILEKEDAQKREVMARLLDLTNANSKAVIAANMEKAVIHFARHEGDTGSPEVQVGVMTVRILALHDHMQRNLQDKRTKRALNMLVHQRQRMLKYLRKKSPERYAQCLREIGLDDSAVVREIR